MSRQNKAVKNRARAKEITRMHLAGEKGAASTGPKHNKRWGYRNNPDVLKRISEAMKAEREHLTNAQKALRGAGKAAVND